MLNEENNNNNQETKQEVTLNAYHLDQKSETANKESQGIEDALMDKATSLGEKIEKAKKAIEENSNLFKNETTETKEVKNEFQNIIQKCLDASYDRKGHFSVNLFFNTFDKMTGSIPAEIEAEPQLEAQPAAFIFDSKKN